MDQFAIFIITGIFCATVDAGLVQIMLLLNMHYIIATTTGFLVSLIINFILHTRFTFSVHYSSHAFVRYLLVVLINYIITLIFVSSFHYWWNIAIIGKLFSLPIITVTGFVFSKFWVYK